MEAGVSERPRQSTVRNPEDDFEESGTQKKLVNDVWIQRRDAKRMLRATKKIAHDLLRATHDQARSAKEPKPEKRCMKVYVTMYDRVGLPFLKHWDGVRRELHVGIENGPWEIRKYLIRVYRLKRLRWVLYRRDLQERWTELPKLLKIAVEGDEFQLEVTGRKKGRPNAPGTSRRQHFNRANSRKTKRDFIWNAPDPYVNASTQVRLAAANRIGYKEEDPEFERNIRERSAIEELRHKTELLQKVERLKPTVCLPMHGGACGGHEEGRPPDLRDTESGSESEDPPSPPVGSPEARRAIRTLEIIDAERQRLDERDQRRAERSSHFKKRKKTAPEKAKKVDPGRALHSKKAQKK
jgi:hypothetical protein